MAFGMRADTKSVSISASPERVFRLVAHPENLPRWAIGFARAVRREGDRWFVTTGGGEVAVRVHADQGTGVVDFVVSPPGGAEVLVASRVIQRGDEAEYVFTQFQAPGMPDDAFEKSVATVSHELAVLRALLETECPL